MAEGSKRGGKSGAAGSPSAGTKGKAKAATLEPSPPLSVLLLRLVVMAGVFGGLLMPLVVLNDYVVFPYIFAKLLYYQALIGLTLPACIALWVIDPPSRPRRSALLFALVFYFLTLGLSTLRSIDPHRSFWSNQERMSGYFQVLHYFAWFLMAGTLLRTWEAWRRLLWWQALIGALMATIAITQRWIPTLIGEGSDVRVSGTLGNAIFSGAWHMIEIYLLAFLWTRTKSATLRYLLVFFAVLSFSALWLSGSRGPLLAIFAGATVSALAWSLRSRDFRVIGAVAGFDALMVGAYFFVARILLPLPALATFWRTHTPVAHIFEVGDSVRARLWPVAWKAFKDRPVTGFGLSTFDLAFDVHYDPWFRCLGLPNTLQDSSHSLIFDHLSCTGVLGLAGFLALWTAVFAALLRALRTGALPQASGVMLIGAPAAYLAQGLFVFDSPGVYVMTYLLMALALAASSGALSDEPSPAPAAAPVSPAIARAFPAGFLVLQALACALVFQTTVQPFRASYGNKRAQQAWRMGSCSQMVEAARANFALPSPWRDDQLFTIARDLGSLASSGRLAQVCPQWHDLVDHARAVTNAILHDHPTHARHRSIFATLIHLVGRETHDPLLVADAGPLMEQLIAESPLRQQYRYDFANWLIDNDKVKDAKAQLESALHAEESIGDSRWRLGTFLWRNLQQVQPGAALMAKAQTGSCPYLFRNAQELQQLAQAYAVLGDRAGLKTMVGKLEDLGRDDKSTPIYLGIASYLERSGLEKERDQVLDLVRQRDLSVISKLAPLKDGRVKSLAELDRLSAGAATSSQ